MHPTRFLLPFPLIHGGLIASSSLYGLVLRKKSIDREEAVFILDPTSGWSLAGAEKRKYFMGVRRTHLNEI